VHASVPNADIDQVGWAQRKRVHNLHRSQGRRLSRRHARGDRVMIDHSRHKRAKNVFSTWDFDPMLYAKWRVREFPRAIHVFSNILHPIV
jgi:hypothetical protein